MVPSRTFRVRLALSALLLAGPAVLAACGDTGNADADASCPGCGDGTGDDGGGDGAYGGGGNDGDGANGDGSGGRDGAGSDGAGHDGSDGDGAGGDSAGADGSGGDAGAGDGSSGDTGPLDSGGGDSGGVLNGGPCMSGVAGVAAYRIGWADAGGTAQVVYEVDGLPDRSRDKAGAYGYQIGFVPQYVDPFLAQGGLALGDDDFVDLEISTVGLTAIDNATLSIYGRSYDTTTSGSFNWQTFQGTGSSPTDLVSNVAPYQWYSADMTTEITPGDGAVLVRIKAGPSSDSLVVNKIEICMRAR